MHFQEVQHHCFERVVKKSSLSRKISEQPQDPQASRNVSGHKTEGKSGPISLNPCLTWTLQAAGRDVMLLFELLLLLFFTLLSAGREEQTHPFSHVDLQENPAFAGQIFGAGKGVLGEKKSAFSSSCSFDLLSRA